MGGCSSRDDRPSVNNSSGSSVVLRDNNNYSADMRVESINRYDEQCINIIRKDLRENPEWFIVNNILMSTQFFENYQKDVLKLINSNSSKMEKELNRILLKDETMECTCPDIIFEKVYNNVRFRPLHGPKKHCSEPLASKRLFVMNDTIEVINSMDVVQYTSIDKPAYQVRIEESKRKGFLRLKQIDTNKLPNQGIYTVLDPEPTPGPSTSSESEEYQYTTIMSMRTPKPLDIIENPERRDTLPETCFSTRKVKKQRAELEYDDDEDSYAEFSEDDFFDNITYVDSKGFMNYFKNALFPNSLGRALGFDELAISEANSIPGKIFCNLTDEEDNPVPCEVVPCIAIPWPSEQTFEFVMREDRPTITDRRTGYRYRWPTDEMLKDIKSTSCVLVPKGYWMKKGNNSDANLEWEIAFPKVERYFETRMSHSQMRCFLFLIVIHKTYIEPTTSQYGLLVEHIRCHMYWECEANYKDWPEHRLGLKLIKVIVNLNSRLSKGILPDYFIKQKNLFENIPKKYLNFAKEKFHNVLQSPAMCFIKALRNLRYTSSKFYPPLDYKELYKIVTHVQGIKIINPDILAAPNPKRKRYHDVELQMRHLEEVKKRQRVIEMKQLEKQNLNNVEERKESVDSIDLEWSCEKQFDIYKTKAILELFINEFIDIAKKSARIGTKDQTRFYLKQAWYLTRILEDTAAAYVMDARNYKEIIKKEEEACKKMAVKEISDVPPNTPMRNSVQFDFSFHQQVKNNVINLNNLSTTFHNGAQPQKAQSFNKLKTERTEKHRPLEANGGLPRKSVAFVEPK